MGFCIFPPPAAEDEVRIQSEVVISQDGETEKVEVIRTFSSSSVDCKHAAPVSQRHSCAEFSLAEAGKGPGAA